LAATSRHARCTGGDRQRQHVVHANSVDRRARNEIFAAAQKKGVMVAFEAAWRAGIPIIKTIREGFTGIASSGSPVS